MTNEIEVKARLRDPEGVRAALAALGCALGEPITQDDRIFRHKDSLHTHGPGVIVLRIRRIEKAAYFTLKQNRSNNSLDCIEQESEVGSPEAMQEALKIMGYAETTLLRKVRQKTKYKTYEICIDKVEELGDFIEVEQMVDDGDGEKIQAELFAFLKELGVKEEDRVMHGYDTLMEMQQKS